MKRKTLLLIFPLMAFLAFTTRAWAQPATPDNVYAAPGNAQAAVRFDVPASSDPASTFTVTVNDTTTNSSTTQTDFTASPILVPNLTNGHSYTFQVTAVDASSVSGTPSSASNAVTPDTGLYGALAGTWNLNIVYAGSFAPYSSYCQDQVDDNGGFTGSCTDNKGNTIVINKGANFVFPSPYGIIPLITHITVNGQNFPASPYPNMVCQASLDNTFAVCTATASLQVPDGSTTLISTMSKQGTSYSQASDLPGAWALNFFNPGSGGTGGDVSQTIAKVSSSGAFTAAGSGSKSGEKGVLALSSSGMLTCVSGSCNSDLKAYMDSGLTTMTGLQMQTSGGDSKLQLFLKQGSKYSLADLAGIWQVNELDSGGYWGRETIVISSSGSFQSSGYDSGGGTDSGSGVLNISPAGVVTCKSGVCSDSASIYMDASKTIMAQAQAKTQSGSGVSYRMQIFAKTASPPTPPTGVSAAAGNAQASVSFTSPASTGGSSIVSYTVTSSPGSLVATGTASPITVTGLTNGKPYTFTVTATNAAGLTSVASAKSKSVKPAGPIPPKAPTGVTAKAGNGQATVNFKLPAGVGTPVTCTVTSYPGNITATGVGSPITVTGLTNGTTYKFRVTVTNSIGTSPASGPSNVVTPATLPDAPTAVSATAGSGLAVVSFTAPNSNGSKITTYMVTSSPDAKHPNGVTAKGSKSPITVKGLLNGTSYTFTVTAKNQIGTGPASAPSSPVTPEILVK